MSLATEITKHLQEKTVFREDLFEEKKILIVGATGGIGLAVSCLFKRLGANLMLVARKEDRLSKIAEYLEAVGEGEISFSKIDVRDLEQVEALFRDRLDLELFDCVVNCAGGQFPQPAIDFDKKGWEAVIDTNLNGSWNLMGTVARNWKNNKKSGNIVNVVVVNQGLFGVAHTSAARAGIIAFSEKAAVEWASLGIRVNCVAPGAIKTKGWEVYPKKVSNCYSKTNPLMRPGTPHEVAEAIAFLSSPAGAFINGETLIVDGGGRHWGEIWTTGKPDYYLDASKIWEDL